MAVMVGTPDIDDFIKAAFFKFVAVISDISGEIGVKSVGTAEHIILQFQLVHLSLGFPFAQEFFLQQCGGVQPQRAVLFIGPTFLCQCSYGFRYIAAVVQL